VPPRTRLGRVRSSNAAVVSITAAFSCSGPSSATYGPVAVTSLLAAGGGVPPFSVGQPCLATGLETCFNARDDNCDGLVDEGCGLASGPLQIVIAWDDADANVDLEVTDPNGEQAAVGRTTAFGLTKDRDCPGNGMECGGQNFEVVVGVFDALPVGRYRVALELKQPLQPARLVHVWIGGQVGHDALRGEVDLSGDKPRVSAELLRSSGTMVSK
jgi:hypothetical protein